MSAFKKHAYKNKLQSESHQQQPCGAGPVRTQHNNHYNTEVM